MFDRWTRQQGVVAGVFELNDYNYEKPSANLLAHKSTPSPPDKSLVYDYPGGYDDKGLGERLTKIKLDAERTLADRCTASGYAPSLTAGFKFQRTSPSGDSQDGEYLTLRCSHAYGDQSYRSGESPAGASYAGDYELCRSQVPYRMPLRTRRPVIVGTQPAKVVGKDGEEIDVDEQGRVLVEFYWDAGRGTNKTDKTRSRRVRVGQPWAGKDRGALFIPRIGDEVMVGYDDGDPDRPIIVGSVYNGDNPDSLVLPARKTVTGLLGKSSKTGGSTTHNANAWWFDDARGQEQFYLRARKDMYMRVYNNENIRVGSNVTETVGGDQTITIGAPTSGGDFTLNAVQTVTINVGPPGAPPLTQIKMDQTSITLNVGPEGLIAQIVMGPDGVKVSGTPASQLMVQPSGITTLTPTMTFGYGPVTFASPMVTIPLVTIGAGTASGLPII